METMEELGLTEEEVTQAVHAIRCYIVDYDVEAEEKLNLTKAVAKIIMLTDVENNDADFALKVLSSPLRERTY